MGIDRNTLCAGLLAALLGISASAQPGSSQQGASQSPSVEPTGSEDSAPDPTEPARDAGTYGELVEEDLRDAPAERQERESVDSTVPDEPARRSWWKFWQRDRAEDRGIERRDDMGEPAGTPNRAP